MSKKSIDVHAHHRQQFGVLSRERMMLKLLEESGELAGAVVRQEERRDDRDWYPEIHGEAMDVLTVLHWLCGSTASDKSSELDLGAIADDVVTSEFKQVLIHKAADDFAEAVTTSWRMLRDHLEDSMAKFAIHAILQRTCALCVSIGYTTQQFRATVDLAADRFCSRTWGNIKPQGDTVD